MSTAAKINIYLPEIVQKYEFGFGRPNEDTRRKQSSQTRIAFIEMVSFLLRKRTNGMNNEAQPRSRFADTRGFKVIPLCSQHGEMIKHW